MASLLFQPAFSIETSYTSTGNSTIGIASAQYYSDILNEKNSEALAAYTPKLSFSAGESGDYYDSLELHQGNSTSNILKSSGSFDLDIVLPQGKDFTFKITLYCQPFIELSNITITIQKTDEQPKSVAISSSSSSYGYKTFYLMNNNDGSLGQTTALENVQSGNLWFKGSSEDYLINISGTQILSLEFSVVIKKS